MKIVFEFVFQVINSLYWVLCSLVDCNRGGMGNLNRRSKVIGGLSELGDVENKKLLVMPHGTTVDELFPEEESFEE